jgi:MFS family permease
VTEVYRGPSPRSTVWPLYVVTFLSTYTVAVASISAPGIQLSLAIPESRTSLVVGAYSATFAAGLIVSGRLGDRWGRRRMFRIGTAALAVTALLTACAPTLELLVVARLLQGCAAAATTPQVLASIQAILTGESRLRAVGLYSVFAGTGTVGGQVIGGVINTAFGEQFGWRAAFASVGVAAFLAWVGARYLTESRSPAPLGLDLRGSITLAASLLLLIAGLTNAASIDVVSPLSPADPLLMTAMLLGASAVGFVLLGIHSRARERARRPSILPLHVIREPGVRIGVMLACLLFVMIGGFMFNWAVLSQLGFGYTPLESGLASALLAVAFVVTSALAPRFVARLGGPAVGGPRVLVIAAVIQGVGLAALGFVALAELTPFVLWFQFTAVLIGGGQGLMLGPLVSVIMNVVPDDVAGLTGGLVATGQQTGLGLGVAVLSTMFAGLAQIMPMQAAYGWTIVGTLVLTVAFGWLAARLGVHGRRAATG